jgi:hypothetical protein
MTSSATEEAVTKLTTADGLYKFVLLAPREFSVKVSKVRFQATTVVSVAVAHLLLAKMN